LPAVSETAVSETAVSETAVSETAAPALLALAPPTLPAARPSAPLARDWTEYRRAAALRIVAANPKGSYTSKAPDPLLAIPVVEVHLGEDGAVEQVRVVRSPSQARDTLLLVEEAIRRAGPFGPVAHLPRPWRFTEVFLFDHARRFKPMILDR
jgi:protein TonB